MCDSAPAGADDLKEGMGVGCIQLELGGELGEEENLDCSPRAVPPCKREGDKNKRYRTGLN